jgi:hypothetical protein
MKLVKQKSGGLIYEIKAMLVKKIEPSYLVKLCHSVVKPYKPFGDEFMGTPSNNLVVTLVVAIMNVSTKQYLMVNPPTSYEVLSLWVEEVEGHMEGEGRLGKVP